MFIEERYFPCGKLNLNNNFVFQIDNIWLRRLTVKCALCSRKEFFCLKRLQLQKKKGVKTARSQNSLKERIPKSIRN